MLRRLRGLIRKEFLQIARDPSSILIAVVLPLVLLFLFGYGVSLDASRVKVGLAVEATTPESSSFASALAASPLFDVTYGRDRRAFEDALVADAVDAVIVLPADFAVRSAREGAPAVQVIVDGAEPNTAALVLAYLDGAWSLWRGQEAPREAAVSLVPRVWFNPEAESRNVLVPGSIAIIMTMVGTLLTALVIAREWERGTMEALLASAAGRRELLIGKLVPYFVLGMLAMGLATASAVFLFGVPFRGSVALLLATGAVFMLAALGQGLLISTVTRNQFLASQAALLSAFLPAFFLSGFVFEIASMPWPIRWLTYIVPARYLVSNLQTLFLAGDVPDVLLPNTAALALIAAVLIARTVRATRLRLD